MADRDIIVPLNQQQLDLVDRTVARGLAADRAGLVRLALRELAETRGIKAPETSPETSP